MEPLLLHQIKLIERLFFNVAFLALVRNIGKLFEFENNHVFLNLSIVKEEFFILFVLIYFISKMPETEYRTKVLGWLKFFLFLFAAGYVAQYGRNIVSGRSNKA